MEPARVPEPVVRAAAAWERGGAGGGVGGGVGTGAIAARSTLLTDINARLPQVFGTTNVYTLSSLVILNRNALNTAGPAHRTFSRRPGVRSPRAAFGRYAIHSIVEPIAKSHWASAPSVGFMSAHRPAPGAAAPFEASAATTSSAVLPTPLSFSTFRMSAWMDLVRAIRRRLSRSVNGGL